jgi:hypothetical protein
MQLLPSMLSWRGGIHIYGSNRLHWSIAGKKQESERHTSVSRSPEIVKGLSAIHSCIQRHPLWQWILLASPTMGTLPLESATAVSASAATTAATAAPPLAFTFASAAPRLQRTAVIRRSHTFAVTIAATIAATSLTARATTCHSHLGFVRRQELLVGWSRSR